MGTHLRAMFRGQGAISRENKIVLAQLVVRFGTSVTVMNEDAQGTGRLCFDFGFPLRQESQRRNDQGCLDLLVASVSNDHSKCLNRLSNAHSVRENPASEFLVVFLFQHKSHSEDLMRHQIDLEALILVVQTLHPELL